MSLTNSEAAGTVGIGPMHGLNILVVDDEPLVADVAAETLRDAGHLIVVAQSGSEALSVLERNQEIDLLLTDVIMPGMNGFVLADTAKARRPMLKVIYVSGYATVALELSRVGQIHGPILYKPYRPSALEQAVRAATQW